MPRYLVRAHLARVPAFTPDVVVVGGGVAGLRAAIEAAATCQVLVVTKRDMGESNSRYAQGGLAAAVGEDDAPDAHVADTLAAGAGLADEVAVREMVERGPKCVRELVEWGARFDRDAHGRLNLTTEGAHSRPRILHSSGDATGREIQRVLLERARQMPNIEVLAHCFAIDLLHEDNEVYGVLCYDARGEMVRIVAQATILATGGAGQLYRETTNPEIATGDGLAMALRAGARLVDLEFMQFHPTTLYIAGAPRFLISEAVRGEGALLLSGDGRRFMPDYHPSGELAPRDVVSTAIVEEMQRTNESFVYLDLRPLGPAHVRARFPNILHTLSNFNLDPTRDLIPVRPSAHYYMGGISTEIDGATSVSRLFAVGECACSGVHGANRLASNSLLEGLTFGCQAGRRAAELALTGPVKFPLREIGYDRRPPQGPIDIGDVTRSLKHLLWRAAGVFRNGSGLSRAAETLAFWRRYVLPTAFSDPRALELQNMIMIGGLLLRAASQRTESRGAHRRTDFPETQQAWQQHIVHEVSDLD